MKKRIASSMAIIAALALGTPVLGQDGSVLELQPLELSDLPFEIHDYVLHASFDGPAAIASEFTGVTARDVVKLKVFNEGPRRARDVQVEISVPVSRSETFAHHYILRGDSWAGSCDEPVNTNFHSTMLCTIEGIGPGKTRTIRISVAGVFTLFQEGDPAPIMEVEARVVPPEQLIMRNGKLSEVARRHWPLATTGGKPPL